MKIGVLGGSFNPIHNGHLILAEQMREHFELAKVLFVPARTPPHKAGERLAPASDRLEMVRLAVSDNEAFEACDIELQREGLSYTVDTIHALQQRYGPGAELHFIVGSDSVRELPTWRNVRELMLASKFLIGARPGFGPQVRQYLGSILPEEELRGLESRTLSIRLIEISATGIRERVRAGHSIRYLVPTAVEQYIRARRLYA